MNGTGAVPLPTARLGLLAAAATFRRSIERAVASGVAPSEIAAALAVVTEKARRAVAEAAE